MQSSAQPGFSLNEERATLCGLLTSEEARDQVIPVMDRPSASEVGADLQLEHGGDPANLRRTECQD